MSAYSAKHLQDISPNPSRLRGLSVQSREYLGLNGLSIAGSFLCWNCGKLGHRKVTCPNLHCYFCGKKGHTKRICLNYRLFRAPYDVATLVPSSQQPTPDTIHDANFSLREGSRPVKITPNPYHQTSLKPLETLDPSPACLKEIFSVMPEENSGSVVTPQKRLPVSIESSNREKSVRNGQGDNKRESDEGEGLNIRGGDTVQIQGSYSAGSTNPNDHGDNSVINLICRVRARAYSQRSGEKSKETSWVKEEKEAYSCNHCDLMAISPELVEEHIQHAHQDQETDESCCCFPIWDPGVPCYLCGEPTTFYMSDSECWPMGNKLCIDCLGVRLEYGEDCDGIPLYRQDCPKCQTRHKLPFTYGLFLDVLCGNMPEDFMIEVVEYYLFKRPLDF